MRSIAIETIAAINHGSSHADERYIKLYHPARLFTTYSTHEGYDKPLYIARQDDCDYAGAFYPTPAMKLYTCTGNYVMTVPAGISLLESTDEMQHPLSTKGLWHHPSKIKESLPDINPNVRLLLDQDYDESLTVVKCAGKPRISNGVHYWDESCNSTPFHLQFFHIRGQIVRTLAVCSKHVYNLSNQGFGRVQPPRYKDLHPKNNPWSGDNY